MKDLNEVFQEITPDSYQSIQTQLQNRNEEIVVEQPKKKRKIYYVLPVMMIVLIAILTISQKPNQVIATVGFDVNPSIAIDIDDQNKIVKVHPYNQDGQKIIGSMKLEGNDIELATNALIGSMLKQGYINELKNSLLISVTGDNQEKNEQLRMILSMHIDEYLKDSQIQGSILSQTVSQKKDIEALASQYQISIGKAEVIQELIHKNNRYTFESLKDLSVNDLNILLHKNSIDIHTTGTQASESGYIGKEKAMEIAVNDAKVSQPTNQHVELDYDDNVMIYEVEFVKGDIKYEYDIQASHGKILKKEVEEKKKNHTNNQSSSQKQITEAKAKTIAMNHASVQNITQYEFHKDDEDGQLEYEMKFVSGQYKYEYTIRAHDGKILDYEKKDMGEIKVTQEEAKNKAFQHANVKATQVKNLEVELEKKYYEVKFEVGQYEYEYHIDKINGQILFHEKERD
ncbi:PepSY domain-containing protein [Candidatus Stoquefichus sp. SB1]|uniref:PepSY domain-containing protein n=1 Tax=Candidatus Stoquefichus sp. SB1 TaxID=1658109 RepID=UPI00067EAA08|nr:PepSY domain-containing protein [Candidatus Stoquefichus sp. SB1]